MNIEADDAITIVSTIMAILLFISELLGWSKCDSNSITQFIINNLQRRIKHKEEEEEEEEVEVEG